MAGLPKVAQLVSSSTTLCPGSGSVCEGRGACRAVSFTAGCPAAQPAFRHRVYNLPSGFISSHFVYSLTPSGKQDGAMSPFDR